MAHNQDGDSGTEPVSVDEILKSRMTRRKAVSTAAKAAIGIGAIAVVGGGGYLAYLNSRGQAASTTTTTSTSTSTATSIATSTVTSTSIGTIVSVSTVTETPTISVSNPGILVVSVGAQALTTLDPGAVIGYGDIVATDLAYDRLWGSYPGKDAIPQPWLVDTYQPSTDGKTHTISIKKNVTFQNGDAMTSADVKYSLDRVVAMGLAISNDLLALKPTISIVDPQTVSISLASPSGAIPTILSEYPYGIVNMKVVEANGGYQAGQPSAYMAANTAGSGPYTVSQVAKGQSTTLQRFDNYWAGKPTGQQSIVFRVIPDTTTQILELQKGDIDMIWPAFAPTSVPAILGDPNITVTKVTVPLPNLLAFNTNDPILGNPLVRQALAYAIPYDQIISVARAGYAVRTNGWQLEGMPGYIPAAQSPYTLDLTKAASMLSSAGYANGFSFPIIFANTLDEFSTTGVLIQQSFAKIGVQVTLVPQAPAVLTTNVFGRNFQAWIAGQGLTGDVVTQMYTFFDSKNIAPVGQHSANMTGYSNPTYDSTIEAALAATDPTQRDTLTRQAVQIILNDVPFAWTYNRAQPYPTRSWVNLTWPFNPNLDMPWASIGKGSA